MSKKSKAPSDRFENYLRFKWGKSEIEANGLGLIPAFLLVLLILVMIGLGGGALKRGGSILLDRFGSDQAAIEKPPP
ncbi:hypothetical protein [uncultured Brevundimonas sp.]|uniref:hypothetical protein n=1 Tax=uncultured Brevundimonas sp. TaxID=213418 RepID=UPI0025D2144A|nr:hypothetical protein [uncultured Brevundimonas sp.]